MTTDKTMTSREFYNAVAEANINDKLTAYAKAEIAKLDKRNAERKDKPTKAQQANEPLKAALLAFLTENEGWHLANDLGVKCQMSTAKASTLCGQLATEGKIKVALVKTNKGKRNAYCVSPTVSEDKNSEE